MSFHYGMGRYSVVMETRTESETTESRRAYGLGAEHEEGRITNMASARSVLSMAMERFGDVSGPQCDEYEDACLLECCAMLSVKNLPGFRR